MWSQAETREVAESRRKEGAVWSQIMGPHVIKGERKRAAKITAAATKKKKQPSSWFENHVIVMSCDDDKEKENKIKEELKARVIMEQRAG